MSALKLRLAISDFSKILIHDFIVLMINILIKHFFVS